MGCHALFQGIFPTQGSNPGLQHCRQILYHLSYQRSPLLQNHSLQIKSGTSLVVWWLGVHLPTQETQV